MPLTTRNEFQNYNDSFGIRVDVGLVLVAIPNLSYYLQVFSINYSIPSYFVYRLSICLWNLRVNPMKRVRRETRRTTSLGQGLLELV